MIWIILIVLAVLFWLFHKFFKLYKVGSLNMITGGVKTGKSTLAVYLAWRCYIRARFKWWFYNKVLYYIFKPIVYVFSRRKIKLKHSEEPLLYSNIPIACKGYAPLTLSLLRREERFRYKSIIYVCEASLVADSMFFKDALANERLLLFNKLIGHETRGGKLFYDTQSVADNHFSVKRSVSNVLYIHHSTKIPFFNVMWVRELMYSDDNMAVNTFQEDVEESLKMIVVPKFIWRKFDCYCYSALTDQLPVRCEVKRIPRSKRFFKAPEQRVKYVLSFKHFETVKTDSNEEEKVNEKVSK